MHVVVTGGAGFIGSHLVRHALAADREVRVTTLDALTYAGHRATLADVADDPRHRLIVGDVTDEQVVAEVMGDADVVCHLAAETHVDRSIDGPGPFLRTNVVGSGVVFEACRRAEVGHLLHVSTDEVYGSVPSPHRSVEDDPLQPRSPYAASKASADLLAAAYGTTYGFPITVARPSNTYGPYQLPEKVIPLFVTRLLDGGRVPLYGDGRQVRDWTFVTDTAAALWQLATSATPGSAWNVAAGQARTNRELTDALLARFDRGPEAVEHVADRPGHDRRYAVDTSRIATLGWRPTVDLDEGLDRTVAWYRDHPEWWRPLQAAGVARRRGRST